MTSILDHTDSSVLLFVLQISSKNEMCVCVCVCMCVCVCVCVCLCVCVCVCVCVWSDRKLECLFNNYSIVRSPDMIESQRSTQLVPHDWSINVLLWESRYKTSLATKATSRHIIKSWTCNCFSVIPLGLYAELH